MAKKPTPLAARQVGRNVIIMIEGKKFSKKTEDNDEVLEIKKKIDLYNKQPSEARLEKIKNIFITEADKEKEKKEVVKKGLKTGIKKEKKKATVKKAVKEAEEPKTGEQLVEEVKAAHAAGTMTDDQIESLQSLLAKEAQERAAKKEQEEERERTQRSSSTGRRGGEH